MGPRRLGRGNVDDTYIKLGFVMLQWGRVGEDAEIEGEQPRLVGYARLQWGRVG